MKYGMALVIALVAASPVFAQCDECKNKGAEFEKKIAAHKAECKLCKEGICGIPEEKRKWIENWKKEHKCKDNPCEAWKKDKSEGEKEIKKHTEECDTCKNGEKCDEVKQKKEELYKKISEWMKKHKEECSKCKDKEKEKPSLEEIKKKHQEKCEACREGRECEEWNKKKEYLEKQKK